MKTIARFVGVAMVLGLVAGAVAPAQAQTVAELQAMIAQLQAQIAGLAGASSTTSATFTRDLTVGSQGADVTALQNILIAKGHLAAGLNTGYFGALTKAAVIKWQATAGVPATGYFGQLSRAAIAGSTTGSTGSTTTGSTSGSELKGGDGDFGDFDVLSSPNNKDVEEGQSERVLGFEVEAEDSDLRIERVNLVFSSTSRPWNSFKSVALVAGDKEIASTDADSKGDWEQDDDDYSISFGDLSSIVREDESVRYYVVVEGQDNIDSEDLGSWTVTLDGNDAIRAENAEGINVYEGPDSLTSDDRTFEFTEISTDVNIKVDADDNEDMTVEVDEEDETEDVVLYTSTFENDETEVSITEVAVTVATTTGSSNVSLENIITTLYLFIDGKEVGSESIEGSATTTVTFEDFDAVSVDEDDEVSIVVKADIAGSDDYTAGDGVQVTGIVATYEDANGDESTESGNAGGEITFSSDAITVTSPAPKTPGYISSDESKGTYIVEFKVTAPEDEEIYLDVDAATTSATTVGARYEILDQSGNAVTSATPTAAFLEIVSGSADDDTSGYIHLEEGDTATLRLTVDLSNTGGSAAERAKVGLIAVNYKPGSTLATTEVYTTGLDADFQTATLRLETANIAD